MPNKNKVQHNFNRFADSYEKYGVLQQEIAKRLFSRLDTINPQVENTLELGSGTGFLTKHLLKKYQSSQIVATDFAQQSLSLNPAQNKICVNAHNLNFTENSFDMVVSNLMMQWCDLEIVVKNSQNILKNNGLFLFSTFGPLTLNELKTSWQGVDDKFHTNEFMDMHDIGDKMLGLGLSGVVVESDIITLTYEKVMDLLLDLKNIGAQNVHANPTTKSKLQQMIKNYEKFRKNDKLPATYEVIYAFGWRKERQADISKLTPYNL